MSMWTNMIRRYYTGKDSRYVFSPADSLSIPELQRANLYIHIPFCKNLCPYCPYNKVKYQEELSLPYMDALEREIDAYMEIFGDIDIGSVYFGGGTPTLLAEHFPPLMEKLGGNFKITGDI